MDIDDRRPRSGSYGSHNASRLPSTDSSLHNNYPPYSSVASSGHSLPGPGPPPPSFHQHGNWVPPPSPYNGNHHDQRPSSAQEPAQHPVSSSTTYGASHRPYPAHAPEPPYSRQGSISAPSRSPIDTPHQSQHTQVNGHEASHSNHHMPTEPGPRHGYVPHETSVGANQPHGLPSYSGNPEMISIPASAPPGLPHYVPHSAASAPGATHYDHAPYQYSIQGYTNQQARRKPVRASQACDTCRARKAKCDEGRPCGHCRDNNLDCQYRELPIPKQDRHVRDQMEKLDAILRRLDGHEHKIDKIQQSLHFSQTDQKMTTSASAFSTPHSAPLLDSVHDSKELSQASPSELPQPKYQYDRQSSQPISSSENRPGELSIPLRHSTHAHKLLEWPAIAKYLKHSNFTTEHYVNNLEQSRPVTRLLGKGEGPDKNDHGRGPSSPADSSSSRSDELEGLPYADGPWGSDLHWPLPVIDGPDHPGGQRADAALNLDEILIEKYFQSYLTHLHILHPFLNRRVLRAMIHRFKKRYSYPWRLGGGSKKRKHPDDGSFPNEVPGISVPSFERQLSHTRHWPDNWPDNWPYRWPPIEHSASNAIILLVLALGKICMCEDKLPGPVAEAYPSPSSNPSHASPQTLLGTRSQLSPEYQDTMASPPNIHEGYSTSLVYTPPYAAEKKRNLDVIPGLAYYSVAIGILAEHLGENSIEEVQACILASLYAGQRAHVAQSHKWIVLACNACQVLVAAGRHRDKSPNETSQTGNETPSDASHAPNRTPSETAHTHNKPPSEPPHARNSAEAIKFAYWTCLQLESDILAEIDLPPSGISRTERDMYDPDNPQMPKGYISEDNMGNSGINDQDQLFFYSSQIHLRIRLNSVHTELYREEINERSNLKSLVDTVQEQDANLMKWRNLLTKNTNLGWDDNSFKASDINVVRMRAKFYGGRYIIHRPVLYKVLHESYLLPGETIESPTSTPGRSSVGASPASTHPSAPIQSKRTQSEMGPPAPRISTSGFENLSESERLNLQDKLKEQCKMCIDAALKSTEVFDAIKGRLIVTNIFGTAHAQFGNMLVLSATYLSKHPFLSQLVDFNELKRLLNRTINFLRRYDEISPTLKADAEILTYIRDRFINPNLRGTPITPLPSTSTVLSRSF